MRVEDGRWAAVLARDTLAAGGFVYAVATTGIYCRADCPSRRPRRENVAFFADATAAEAAGYRPCRRCVDAPSRDHARRIAAACAALDGDFEPPLAELAAMAGLSDSHFHRLFKRLVGMTPKAYAGARRADRLRRVLPLADTVTAAVYEAGYGASSRMYERADAVLGMAPGNYRQGGARERIRYAVAPCALGHVVVAATERGVCLIELGDDADALAGAARARFPQAEAMAADPEFAALVARVVALVDEPAHPADLPLDIRGTAFQQRVWAALRAIPPGRTMSYSDIAAQLGNSGAVRAVGAACAANTLAVAIPCHRAIGRDGALRGYRWGVERKRALLEREGEGG